MKNLKTAIGKEIDTRTEAFIKDVKKEKTELSIIGQWRYNDLMPKGSKKVFSTLKDRKEYLINRKIKYDLAILDKENAKIESIFAGKDFTKISITVEYKKIEHGALIQQQKQGCF